MRVAGYITTDSVGCIVDHISRAEGVLPSLFHKPLSQRQLQERWRRGCLETPQKGTRTSPAAGSDSCQRGHSALLGTCVLFCALVHSQCRVSLRAAPVARIICWRRCCLLTDVVLCTLCGLLLPSGTGVLSGPNSLASSCTGWPNHRFSDKSPQRCPHQRCFTPPPPPPRFCSPPPPGET